MFSTSSYQLNSARNTAEYQKIGGSYSHTQCLLGFKQIFEIKSDTLGDTVSKNPHYSSPDIRIQSSYPTGHPFLEKSRTILYHHHHHHHHLWALISATDPWTSAERVHYLRRRDKKKVEKT